MIAPVSRLDMCRGEVLAGGHAAKSGEELLRGDGVSLIRGKAYDMVSSRPVSVRPSRGIANFIARRITTIPLAHSL